MTLAMTIVADLVPPRERGRYQGYIQMVFVLASVAGPLLGGVLSELSWRWIFYVNLPIGAAALTAIAATLTAPARGEGQRPQVDYAGAALLTAALSSLLLVTTWGGRTYAWDSAETLGLGAASVAAARRLPRARARAPEPILPLRLFRDPVFSVASATLFLAGCAFFAVIVFTPTFLQLATGATPTESGLLLLPLLLSATATTAVAGRVISRTGRYKAFPVAGLALMTAGLVLMTGLAAGTSVLAVSLMLVVFGIGFGMFTQVLVIAVQNAADRRDIGIATASTNLFRALGGSVGVAVFGSVFAARPRRRWPAGAAAGGGRGVARHRVHRSRRRSPRSRCCACWRCARCRCAGRRERLRAMDDQTTRGERFRALHEGEPFVIPNPWDAGSARVLEGLGFAALATTSSAFAFTLGRSDGEVTLDELAAHVARARRRHEPADLRRPRERLRRRARGRRAGDRPRGGGRRGRRLDRGLGSRRAPVRARPRGRARGGRGRGRARAGLPVHAHRPRREPHPRQPRPRGHDRPPAGLRGRGRRTCSTRPGCAARRDPRGLLGGRRGRSTCSRSGS